MIRNPLGLVGKRFSADFRVAGIGPPPYTEDTVVVIYKHGERCELSLGELSTLIETGFVVELPEHQ